MTEDTPPPEFSLPDWGTGGAPSFPAIASDAEEADRGPVGSELTDSGLIEWTGAPLLTTDLPSGFVLGRVLGVVSASARQMMPADGEADAIDDATTAALAALAATTPEADAVIAVRLTTTVRKDIVVVTAYGTAVTIA